MNNLNYQNKIREDVKALSNFFSSEESHGIKVIVDEREKDSGVVEELELLKVNIRYAMLEVGDYVVSENVAIERKTTKDFSNSIVDGRLFNQAKSLKESYPQPLIIIEGEDVYEDSNLHPNAVTGALISLAVDFYIPVLFSNSQRNTAQIILKIAEREQLKSKKAVRIREHKKPMDIRELQIYLLSGLPYIERTLAERLLSKFNSPINVFNANIEELMTVEGIGKTKATKIKEVLTRPWNKS
ncbi:MAG: ERCC4 domain-containing protein [Thermoproteota archaeon]